MSKAYTDTDFVDQILNDRSWRIKEISDLKVAARRADDRLQRVLLRAIVAIGYAHFEGYIRYVARKYLEYVSIRKMQYRELHPQFRKNYFLPRLASYALSGASVSERCALIEDILSSREMRFSKANEDIVNTRSNLNFDVFIDICLVCSVPIDSFLPNRDFIDLIMLKRRNAIAHGEETYIEIADLDMITDSVIELMRKFGNEMENQVVLKKYLAAQRTA